MKRTLYLHIGLPKTGSTSIQMFLHENADLLEERGLCFPDFYSFAGGGHSSLVAYASLETGSRVAPFTRITAERLVGVALEDPKYRTNFQKIFESSLEKSKASTFIITSESLYTQIRDLKQIQALYKFLSAYFSEIMIIGYLRPQESWIASRLSQTVKLGQTHDAKRLIKARVNDYYTTLRRWWEVFGKQNMKLGVLDRASLHKGDLIADIMNVMGMNEYDDFKMPIRKNESLSADMILFLQYFNHHVPGFLEGNHVNPNREGLVEVIETYSVDKPRYKMDAEKTDEIRQQYAHCNESLLKDFFPERDALFNLPDGNKGQSETFDVEAAIEIAAYLWTQQQNKIERLKRENFALRAKVKS